MGTFFELLHSIVRVNERVFIQDVNSAIVLF
jgi:hypothetical protein